MNLLKETKEILNDNGKTINDIKWVGTSKNYIDKDLALKLFDKEYDSGFGAQEVAIDLLVVGDNWWLERHEYDGSEWWEMKEMPIKPTKEIIPTKVIDDCWKTLEMMNEDEEDNEVK